MEPNVITLQQAQTWAQNWNVNKLKFFETRDLKAFLISEQVLQAVTAPQQVVDIRTYLGLDEQMNPHMMIVGVDADGNDLIDYQNGLYIYNFTRPCPTYCPKSAPYING
ncbi:hypothetical protein H9Y05_11010 [Crocinitomicaceae bacterium CZZ-1]|uniref:Uncharacterized protein n=1 Tax=Taishania pollutisoli TaxID=2766479 RepID=A0A8J6TTE6_9FLAO|nr:hypothetical protein [Taishania pollutisoli]MBC9812997.1 hypothetical protein [Taishania pollutisoli]MBX2948730.1 hypothetical protein [Crocinitomicaceae bacterium]NGF75699.1 hypothetical protein [Fluviicola sp. SGL-29]